MITVGFAPFWRFKEESDHGSHRIRHVVCDRVVHGTADPRPDRLNGAACALALTLLFAPAAFGQTYTVEVHPELNGLDIKIEPVTMTGMLVVKLTNDTEQKVRCKLRFDASPQTPYRNSVTVDPGQTEQSVFRAQRKWFAVAVEVDCEAATP